MGKVNWKIAHTLEAVNNCIECDFIILEDTATGDTVLYDGVLKRKLFALGNFQNVQQSTISLVERNNYTLYNFIEQCEDADGEIYPAGMYTYDTTLAKFATTQRSRINNITGTIPVGSKTLTLTIPPKGVYVTSYCKGENNKIVPVETQLIEATDTEDGSVTFELYEAQDFDVECFVRYAG